MSCSYDDYAPHIETEFGTPADMLLKIRTFYPESFSKNELSKLRYLAHGCQAYAFTMGDRVWKFTLSKSHARIASHLVSYKGARHLVSTEASYYMPNLKLWAVVEERLHPLPRGRKKDLDHYLDMGAADPDADLDALVQELHALRITECSLDLLSSSNLMVRKDGCLVAHDFGFTDSPFQDKSVVWTC